MANFDIRNFKCVPLDLLKNIGEDGSGNEIITITSDNKTLKDFKKQEREEVESAGPSAQALSADTLENVLVGIFTVFAIVFFLVILYWGFLNFRAKGLSGFGLPEQLRALPAVLAASLFFSAVGFLIGHYVKF